MFALPPPEHGSTVTSASGVNVWLGSLRYAGRSGFGRAMRSGSEHCSWQDTWPRPLRPEGVTDVALPAPPVDWKYTIRTLDSTT